MERQLGAEGSGDEACANTVSRSGTSGTDMRDLMEKRRWDGIDAQVGPGCKQDAGRQPWYWEHRPLGGGSILEVTGLELALLCLAALCAAGVDAIAGGGGLITLP